MTRKDFLKKYEVYPTSIINYVKKFPEISSNNKIDYQKLDEIIQHRIKIREKTAKFLKTIKASEIDFMFKGNNPSKSHHFIKTISSEKQQFFVRDSVYEKCLKVLKHFNVDVNDN